ncbi:MAG: hypothetical protein K5882_05965 [Bacteroidales bacterium]|nr:hypothetical protein [Bacteroidales bacterium]
MDPNDYPKGSYLNPYTEEEHQTKKRSGSWCGGWLKEEDNSLVYYSPNDVTSTNHGLKAAPYDYGVYTDLLTYGQWLGGWVGSYPGNVCYYTENNTQYYDDDYVFGSENYPVPVDVYSEMCRLGLWNGGWVQYEDHDPYYVSYSVNGGSTGYDGYGCGYGSGDGSGSDGNGGGEGSGYGLSISPGEAVVGSNDDGTIKLQWTSKPLFNFEIYLCDGSSEYAIDKTSLFAMWDSLHTVVLTGTVHYIKRFDYTMIVVENGVPHERTIRHSIWKELSVNVSSVTI